MGSTGQLGHAAWASASTYRVTDHRGGANGARIRLSPQKDWEANDPADLEKVLSKLEEIQATFNAKHSGAPVSMADLVVLAGGAAIEEAAKKGGHAVKVPFSAGPQTLLQSKRMQTPFPFSNRMLMVSA